MNEPNSDNDNIQVKLRRFIPHVFPFVHWFKKYSFSKMRSDMLAGFTVALVLIPQSMAYAQIAGLPPIYGLYAAFLPPIVATLFGSSFQLATGPVAVVSLMTATALEPLATSGSEAYIAYAIFLSLIVGIFQFMLGLFKMGVLVNFLSHPVINGFTNAAAIIIASSQLSKLFGVYVDKSEHHYQTILNIIKAAYHYSHIPTILLAVLAFAIMIILRRVTPKIPNVLVAVIVTSVISWAIGFEKNAVIKIDNIINREVRTTILSFNENVEQLTEISKRSIELRKKYDEILLKANNEENNEMLSYKHRLEKNNLLFKSLKRKISELRYKIRSFHLIIVKTPDGILKYRERSTFKKYIESESNLWRIKVSHAKIDVNKISLIGGGAVVGSIPAGLPNLKKPIFDFNILLKFLSIAVIISLLGFMEAISIAKAIATKTGQKLDANQELIGQGLSNIFGSFAQSYPVSGSFSRSAVNLQAGGITGLSNLFSSAIVLITLLWLTPLLYYLPQGVLAAIIMMAVAGLVNVSSFIQAWKAQKYDGVISIVTFVTTLVMAPHLDKGIMIGVILSLVLFLFRNMKPDISLLSKANDGAYRSVKKHFLEKCKHVALIRFNGSLFFANANYLQEAILEAVSSMPELRHVILVGNGINELDASGQEMLHKIVDQLHEVHIDFSISGLNDHVLDVLHRTHLYNKIGKDHFYHSCAHAVEVVYLETHQGTTEASCPLVNPIYHGIPVSLKAQRKKRRWGKPPK